MRRDEAKRLRQGDVVVNSKGHEVVVDAVEVNVMDGSVTVTDRITGRRYPSMDLKPKR